MELSKTPVVKLLSWGDLVFALSGEDRYPTYIYAQDVLKAVTNGGKLKFNKIMSKTSHTISAGSYQGKTALAVGSGR